MNASNSVARTHFAECNKSGRGFLLSCASLDHLRPKLSAREAAIYAEHIIDAGRREPLERLAHFLLGMLTRMRAVGYASENSFVMPLSQEGIGDVLGLMARTSTACSPS
jgi:hypothetical protein